jgi:hypothetical protein
LTEDIYIQSAPAMSPKQSIPTLVLLPLLIVLSLPFLPIKPALAASGVDSRGNYIPPFPHPFSWHVLIMAGGIGISKIIMVANYDYKSRKRKKEREATRLLEKQSNDTKEEVKL